MSLKKSVLCGTTGAVLAGSIGLSTLLVPNASAGHGDMGGHVMTGPTGNKVEMVDPPHSMYVPHIAAASEADRAKAQKLLDGVNKFCRTHSAAALKAKWRPGLSNPRHPTHFFNPDPKSTGLRAANPRAALVYNGKLDGVMFVGVPLPSFGSIPRAHSHDMSMPVEMLHVYCTRNLKEAFTPNRMLGVMADLVMLRLMIRPAVMDLNEAQLRAVRAKVRGYASSKLQAMAPVASATKGGPDPVLQAIRTEIRRSLMVLTEAQLRSVWSLMQSY